MTLCPVALAVGCKQCALFSVCPLKGVIGDFKQPEQTQMKQQANQTQQDEK